MNIFIPILKVDAAKREVYGVMAEDAVDKANEIFDYDTSKPYVKAWVEDFEKTTDGKSFGNVRAMHSSVAAGKLIGITFDDAKKCIPVVAKIVDDNEWKKVEEGVYTGFSIGGKYVKKWIDPGTTATRYTAKPSEVSIVDNPCMPGAKFTMVKADGVEESREFKKNLWDVGRCAELIQSLAYVHDGLAYEAEYENDGSLIPGRLKAAVESLVAILIDLAVEEGRELTAGLVAKFHKGEKEMPNTELQKHLDELTKSITKDFDEKLKKMSEAQNVHLGAIKDHLDSASEHVTKCMGEGAEKTAAKGDLSKAGFISVGRMPDGVEIFKRDPAFVPATPGANADLASFKSEVEKQFQALTAAIEKIGQQPAGAAGAVTGRTTSNDATKGANPDGKSKAPIRFVPGGVEKSEAAMELMKTARENREPVNPELLAAAQ